MAIRRFSQHAPVLGLLTIVAFGANQAGSPTPGPRIVGAINEAKLVQLVGNTHPLALSIYDLGAVPDSFPMGHMLLQLWRSPSRERVSGLLSGDRFGAPCTPAQTGIDSSQKSCILPPLPPPGPD